MKKNSYQKSHLVRELGVSAGVPQKKIRRVLEALQQIVYREAVKEGFTLPGLCRFDILHRKARQVRNPQTGARVLIAEHDALRVRILKKARNAVTPVPENLIVESGDPKVIPPALEDFSKAVSFCCKKCNQEVEAPLSAAGMVAECPGCGAPITVPSESEPGTVHGPVPPVAEPVADAMSVPTRNAISSVDDQREKGRTIRIDLTALGFDVAGVPQTRKPLPQKRIISFFCTTCRQEIEAPADMAGTSAECPACGTSFEVPFFSDPGTLHGSDLEHKKPDPKTLRDMKSRTIRIEVPDDI